MTKPRKQTTIWTCKDGKRLRICDMTDSHLQNAIAMLERKAKMLLPQEISAAYSCLAMMSGDMAQFYCEQDIERMEESTPEEWLERVCPIYGKLLEEQERRQQDTVDDMIQTR